MSEELEMTEISENAEEVIEEAAAAEEENLTEEVTGDLPDTEDEDFDTEEDEEDDWEEEDDEPEPLANPIEGTKGLSWELDEDGVLLIRGKGRIPDYNMGKNPKPAPWEEIADSILELEIEEGITEVGMAAFRGCTKLELAVLPKTLVKVHSYAFAGCTSLTDVYYDLNKSFIHMYEQNGRSLRMSHSLQEKKKAKGLIVMGMQAFAETPWAIDMWGDYYVSGGVLIECIHESAMAAIPEDVEEIGTMAFQGKNITSVLFREGLKVIERFAFQNTKIREVILPSTIRRIGYGAFAGTPLRKAIISGYTPAEVDPDAFLDTCIDLDPDNMHAYEFISDPNGIAVDGVNKLGVAPKKIKVTDIKDGKKQLYNENGAPMQKVEGLAGYETAEIYTPVLKLLQAQKAVIGISFNDAENTITSVQTLVWNKKDKKPVIFELSPVDIMMNKDNPTPDNDAGARRITKDEVKAMFPPQNAKGMLQATSISPVNLDARTHTEWYSTADRNMVAGPVEYAIMSAWMQKYPEYHIAMN